MASVIVQEPATPGDMSLETIVTYTNYEAPNAQLKVCKVAGFGVGTGGTPVNFSVVSFLPPGTTTSVAVPAGPMGESGYCQLLSSTFQVGTSVTVTETVPAGDGVPTVTVNGAPATPSPCALSTGGFPCSVTAAIGAGVNEVSFTNTCTVPGLTPPTPCTTTTAPGGGGLPDLKVVNYSLVSQVATTGTQSYMTYQADLLNAGTTGVGPVIARLSSLVPSAIQVVGQGELNFAPTPAYGQAPSSNTFTVLADPTAPLDFSMLSWTYYSSRSIPARR
jgi:hypothetical protein